MLKSRVSRLQLTNNSFETLEGIIQVSIYNAGETNVYVMGQEIEPKTAPFVISPSNTYFDFDLKEIVFPRKLDIEDNPKVIVRYQKVILPNNC